MTAVCGQPSAIQATPRNQEQNKQIHVLLSKLQIPSDIKKDIVHEVTQGRVISTKDLTYQEADAMIKFLQRFTRGRILVHSKADDAQKMRRKILSICHDIGWEDDKGAVDKTRLENWLLKYGYMHKTLMDYTLEELPALLTQFEKIQKAEYSKWKRK